MPVSVMIAGRKRMRRMGMKTKQTVGRVWIRWVRAFQEAREEGRPVALLHDRKVQEMLHTERKQPELNLGVGQFMQLTLLGGRK